MTRLVGKSTRLVDWRKAMSDNIAAALLVYTGLQIFVTTTTVKAGGASMLPYLALAVLVLAVIPACRQFERRWDRLTQLEAIDPALAPRFRRDRLALWLAALGLPFLVAGVYRLFAAIV